MSVLYTGRADAERHECVSGRFTTRTSNGLSWWAGGQYCASRSGRRGAGIDLIGDRRYSTPVTPSCSLVPRQCVSRPVHYRAIWGSQLTDCECPRRSPCSPRIIVSEPPELQRQPGVSGPCAGWRFPRTRPSRSLPPDRSGKAPRDLGTTMGN